MKVSTLAKQLGSEQYEAMPQQQRYGSHLHVPPQAAHCDDILGTISESNVNTVHLSTNHQLG